MKLLKMVHTSFPVPTSYTDAALSLLMRVWVLKSMVLFLLKTKGYGKSSASQVFDRRNVVFILKISSLHKGVPLSLFGITFIHSLTRLAFSSLVSISALYPNLRYIVCFACYILVHVWLVVGGCYSPVFIQQPLSCGFLII